MRYSQFAASGVLLCIGLPASAQIYDNSSLPFTGDSSIAGGGAIGTLISVGANQTISSFAMKNGMNSAGLVKFFIYDDTTSTFVYTSPATPFGADASPAFKQSDPLNVTLLASDQYYFGLISDQVTDNPYRNNATTYSQGGLTSPPGLRNFGNFTNPTALNVNSTDSDEPLQVFAAAATTPEPDSVGLLGSLGTLGSLLAFRLRRRRK